MENPGFYAILPANVRYDTRLNGDEKILYAEITALADQTGYCYAGNQYFVRLYGSTERTIQRWLKHLQECGYVVITYNRDGGANQRCITPVTGGAAEVQDAAEGGDKNVAERHRVSPDDKNVTPTPTKMSPTPRQKCHPEQYKNNTTRENNTPARARASAADVLAAAFPADERLTKALMDFYEFRKGGKHPLTEKAAELICSKLNRLADEANVRDRSGYMVEVLNQSIVNGWESVWAYKDNFVDHAPAVRPANTEDRPREITPESNILDFL